MYFKIFFAIILVCLPFSFSIQAENNPDKTVIIIDPGHGGSDFGAVYSSIKESDLVLSFSQKLKHHLSSRTDLTTHLTRQQDINVGLSERIQNAHENKGQIFISIHANAIANKKVRGIELFFKNSVNFNEDKAALIEKENQIVMEELDQLALTDPSKKAELNFIVEDLKKQGQQNNSYLFNKKLKENLHTQLDSNTNISIKQAPFYVVSKSTMPSVLIELGFLSHPQESLNLKNSNYQNKLIQAISNSIIQYSNANILGNTHSSSNSFEQKNQSALK